MTNEILYGERKVTLEASEVWFTWLIAGVLLGALALISVLV